MIGVEVCPRLAFMKEFRVGAAGYAALTGTNSRSFGSAATLLMLPRFDRSFDSFVSICYLEEDGVCFDAEILDFDERAIEIYDARYSIFRALTCF